VCVSVSRSDFILEKTFPGLSKMVRTTLTVRFINERRQLKGLSAAYTYNVVPSRNSNLIPKKI